MTLPNLPVLGQFPQKAQPKPSRLERVKAKQKTVAARRAVKAAVDRDEAKRLKAIREFVLTRDKLRSRASGRPVKLVSDNELELGHAHHIQFASQQGSDEPFNRVTLTPDEHEMAHARGSKFVLDIHGDANGTLTFVKRHMETGQIVKTWESPNPSA